VESAAQRGLCTCARQQRQRTGLNPHPSEGSVEKWCALARAPHLCTPARALHAPSMWLAMGGSVWQLQILATGSTGPRGGRLCCLVSEHAHWTFPSGARPVCVFPIDQVAGLSDGAFPVTREQCAPQRGLCAHRPCGLPWAGVSGDPGYWPRGPRDRAVVG